MVVAAMTLASSLFVASCATDEGLGSGEGDGKLKLTVSLLSDVPVTRATDTEATQNCKISVYSSKGLVRQYKSLTAVPEDGIVLLSGDYRVDVEAGDSVAASFDKKYFKGSAPFTITTGTTQAAVNCKIANVVASATFDESIKTMLTDYSLTVSNAGGSLTFTEENVSQKGYFMMESADDSLTYVLTGKKISDGQDYSYKGSVKQPKGGFEYAMTVKYGDADLEEIGGALIRIEVDEKEIIVYDNHTLTMPPAFFAEDFTFADGLINSPGDFKQMTLYVSCVPGLKSCTVSGNLLTAMGFEDGSYDLMNKNVQTVLEAKGININYKESKQGDEIKGYILAMDISADLLNGMEEGQYTMYFNATDNKGKTSTGTLNVTSTSAFVLTQDAAVSDVNTYSATVTALIADATKTSYGIKYRKWGDTEWTTATSTVKDKVITANLTGLAANTKYEFTAVADEYTTPSKTFTTLQALQLQNGDMESWYSGSDKALCIGTSASDLFWDSGNHGSITMSKNVTSNSSDVKHSGNYSAMLKSQFVGVSFIGKFAAGNLFIGKYLNTNGTDGELGFGRAFKARPYAMKVYVKYTPGKVDYTDSGAPDCKKGENDKGIIYVAMLNGTTKSYGDSSWPCIIKTKTKELFSKTDANVLGYGEWSSTSATDGMIEVTIPIDYNNMNEVPSNIIVCCSASAYGDYFAGSSGSVMYVDDFELLYK